MRPTTWKLYKRGEYLRTVEYPSTWGPLEVFVRESQDWDFDTMTAKGWIYDKSDIHAWPRITPSGRPLTRKDLYVI